jgi:hypothetical protein
MSRTIKYLIDYKIVLRSEEMSELTGLDVLEKYLADYERMEEYIRTSRDLLQVDKNSRRAMILNTFCYNEVYPCFLAIHPVRTSRNRFTLIVTQRALDLAKLKDDCIFFTFIAQKLTEGTDIFVDSIIINVNHVHKEIS